MRTPLRGELQPEGQMLQLLVDTCVWLDAAKDYRHQATLHAVEQMIEVGEISLIVPRQSATNHGSPAAGTNTM
jgi:hypothetical protein